MWKNTMISALGFLIISLVTSVALCQESEETKYDAPDGTETEQKADNVKVLMNYVGKDLKEVYKWHESKFPAKRFEMGSNKAFFMQAESELDREINETAKKLRQAKSDDERTQASQALIQLLSKDYDERLETYEASLKALEDKVGKMRTNLQKRRDAKSDMIQLRIRQLTAEADGLGWPKRMGPSTSFGQNRIGGLKSAYFPPHTPKTSEVPPTAPTPRGNND